MNKTPLVLLSLFIGAFALQKVTITVHSGETHTFLGLGASSVNSTDYQQIPEARQDDLALILWGKREVGGLGFNMLRLWARISSTPESFLSRYQKVYEKIHEHNPEVKVLLGPTGTPSTPQAYAAHYANLIEKIKDVIPVYATGIANEPNAHNLFRPEETPVYVKLFREELDKRGLQHVKIIAPETSNVDDITFNMVEALKADVDAMNALHAFSTHSYNMCVVKYIRDMVWGLGKQYWQTECSDNGKEGDHDSVRAIQAIARAISDINLTTNRWLWFIGWEATDPADAATKILMFDPEDGEYTVLLKFFYFRAFSRAFDDGAGVRLCEAASYADNDRFRWMENWYGEKPAICAGAALNPDGSWGFTVANQSGCPPAEPNSTWPDADQYEITFHVEELEGKGGMILKVMRTSDAPDDAPKNVVSDSVIVDNNGEFTVTVNPTELVCLRNKFNELYYPIETTPYPPDTGTCGMGFGFAFIPPLGFRFWSAARKRRRRA